MRLQNHPNVLPLHCSFVHQQHLWMVMPYISGGSVLNIMKYSRYEVSPPKLWSRVWYCSPSSGHHMSGCLCRALKSLSLPQS